MTGNGTCSVTRRGHLASGKGSPQVTEVCRSGSAARSPACATRGWVRWLDRRVRTLHHRHAGHAVVTEASVEAGHRRIVWDATAGEEVALTCGRTGLAATCGRWRFTGLRELSSPRSATVALVTSVPSRASPLSRPHEAGRGAAGIADPCPLRAQRKGEEQSRAGGAAGPPGPFTRLKAGLPAPTCPLVTRGTGPDQIMSPLL